MEPQARQKTEETSKHLTRREAGKESDSEREEERDTHMCHAHTVTAYRKHKHKPNQTKPNQTKQNKSGSNNLIQFDWPDEQVGEGNVQFPSTPLHLPLPLSKAALAVYTYI